MAESDEAQPAEPRRVAAKGKSAKPAVANAANPAEAASEEAVEVGASETQRRKIPGNIPYTVSPGVLKRVLERIPRAEKPPVFSVDFLGTVLEATGGAARPVIPILKATQMLNQGGVPTELYGQFQTEGGRQDAALQALQNGFPEIFRRNSYAHNATESALIDILVTITGLTKTDRILRFMLATFQCFQEYAKGAKRDASLGSKTEERLGRNIEEAIEDESPRSKPLQLVYNINVVLPETTNVEVFNAIFKSLKGNLLS